MQSRAKLLGHAIHPMLIVLPLGLFVAAVVFDLIYLGTSNGSWSVVGYWNALAGVIGGLLAAVFGLADWLDIPKRTRARRIGAIHGIGNVIVVACFAMSFLVRRNAVDHAPGGIPIVLEILGIGLGFVTGWLGGELVERLGVGVTPGAHLDAPSSLRTRTAVPEATYPAREEERRHEDERHDEERRRRA